MQWKVRLRALHPAIGLRYKADSDTQHPREQLQHMRVVSVAEVSAIF
jgi:hypothetical protein